MFFTSISAYADLNVNFINNSGKIIEFITFEKSYSKRSYKEKEANSKRVSSKIYALENGKKFEINVSTFDDNPVDYSYLNEFALKMDSKYKIVFYETSIPCQWITYPIIGTYAYGWGVTLKINNKKVGTICVNKREIIEFGANIYSDLEYYKENENYYIKFSNTGSWPSNQIFPVEIKYLLEDK